MGLIDDVGDGIVALDASAFIYYVEEHPDYIAILDPLCAAATLRARHDVRTPDALQLAAALMTGCTVFVTNDSKLRDLPGLRVIQLRDVA